MISKPIQNFGDYFFRADYFKQKRLPVFAYRPPIESNKLTFFNEVSNTFHKAVSKCDNILVTGDLAIDFSNSKMDTNNYLSGFNNTFRLTNIVNFKLALKP